MEYDFEYLEELLIIFDNLLATAYSNTEQKLSKFCLGFCIGLDYNAKEALRLQKGYRVFSIKTPPREMILDEAGFAELLKTQNASDILGETFNAVTSEEFTKEQILSATRYHRPDWAFFYMLGELTGQLVGNSLKETEFEYFLSLFPVALVAKYEADILRLTNLFLIRKTKLEYIDHDGRRIPALVLKEEIVPRYIS